MGYSPIPTDICLVGADNDSVDEFDSADQSPICDTDDPQPEHAIDFDDTPCAIADTHNWDDDDIDDVRALVDTGAMVTCTGLKHIIHHYKSYASRRPCPIRLKAALSTNDSVTPEGYGFLKIRSADRRGSRDVLVHYHPSITGTLLSPTSVIDSALEPNRNFAGQSIHRWFVNDSLLTGNMTLVCHHRRSKARNIVIHGRLLGGQLCTSKHVTGRSPSHAAELF